MNTRAKGASHAQKGQVWSSRAARGSLALSGILFFLAGVSKLVDLGLFEQQLSAYQILPERFTSIAATLVSLVDIAVGTCMILPQTRATGAKAAFLLVGMYTIVIAVSMANGLEIACGCFGGSSDDSRISWWLILRNAGLLAMFSLAAWRLRERPLPGFSALAALRESGAGALVSRVTFVVMIVLTVHLAQENRILRTTMAGVNTLDKGDHVPLLNVAGADGEVARIKYGDRRRTNLFVFSAGCTFCADSIAVWNSRQGSDEDSTLSIGISLSSVEATRAFAHEHGIAFPVFFPVNREAFVASYRTAVVPQTIELDSMGKVVSVWIGGDDQETPRQRHLK